MWLWRSSRSRTASRSAPSGSTTVAWRRAAVPGGGGDAPMLPPGVRADVMVIAAGAQERRLAAELGREPDAERVAVIRHGCRGRRPR
jgi:hypothetical protein